MKIGHFFKNTLLGISILTILTGCSSNTAPSNNASYAPTSKTECNLNALQGSYLNKQFNFASDPAGLAASLKNTPANRNVKAIELFQTYAKQNNCELYVLSTSDLVKGLLKGLDTSSTGNDDTTTDDMQNKYLLVSQRKQQCTQELNLQLPIQVIKP